MPGLSGGVLWLHRQYVRTGPAMLERNSLKEGNKRMDVKTCIQKLRYVCSASMGTVDSDGKPQVRIINIMHVEPEKGEI